MASVGKRECSPGSLHTVPSAALSGTKEWYQSRCHWITQFPQTLTTSGPEQMTWQTHPCPLASTGPLRLSWCPELRCPSLKRGLGKSSVGSMMLVVLLPVLQPQASPAHRACWAAGERRAMGQRRVTGRQAGSCSSCDSSLSSSRASDGGRTSFGMWH